MCKIRAVITHGGAPHKDEFLALGLALSAGVITLDTPVFRRFPTEEEIADREVMVLDVGGHHDPIRNNFDHHHLPGGDDCALSLLAKHLRHNGLPYHNLFAGAPWYQAVIDIDNKGPFQFAKDLGMERIPYGLVSIIEVGIIDSIRGNSMSRLHLEIAKLIMDQKISEAELFLQQTPWLEENAQFHAVNGFYFCYAPTRVAVGVDEFIKRHGKDVAVSVIFDDRNPGLSLRRVNDDSRIDFRRLEGHEQAVFIHHNGFLMKTRDKLSVEELTKLIQQAVK